MATKSAWGALGERLKPGMVVSFVDPWLCALEEERAQLERIKKNGKGSFKIIDIQGAKGNALVRIKNQRGQEVEIRAKWFIKETRK